MLKLKKTRNLKDLEALFKNFDFNNDCYVIKPNFYNEFIGYYTEVETLDLFLSLLKGKKYATESYTSARTDLSIDIPPGKGRENREYLRQQDEIFFKSSGLGELFKKHDVEFINVTEENWSGKTVKPEIIKALVERKYSPVVHAGFYATVPEKLFELRNATLVNLAKLKVLNVKSDAIFFTMTMKNLFGMIPEPNRRDYHGGNFDGLASSINDMCKIYMAVFENNLHVLEAIHRTLFSPTSLTTGNCKFSNPNLVENLNFCLVADNPVEADAYVVSLFGIDPRKRHFLRMGEKSFGGWKEADFPKPPAKFKKFFHDLRSPSLA